MFPEGTVCRRVKMVEAPCFVSCTCVSACVVYDAMKNVPIHSYRLRGCLNLLFIGCNCVLELLVKRSF